jgi:hypothetical protein
MYSTQKMVAVGYNANMVNLQTVLRSYRVVRAFNCQCQSRISPAFDPSILRHSGICGVADEAVFNNVGKMKKSPKIPLIHISLYNTGWQ